MFFFCSGNNDCLWLGTLACFTTESGPRQYAQCQRNLRSEKSSEKKDSFNQKRVRTFCKDLTAKQPFMQDSIGVTDPKKFLDSILPYMIKQKMILEERQNGKIFYKIRKD